MSDLETARANVRSLCIATKTDFGAHTVTFQPLLTRKSEDRLVTECWEIQGQQWLFLAVCDGIGGCYASQNVAANLPGRIRDGLVGVLEKTVRKHLDRGNVAETEPSISTMLVEVVLAFDDNIGQALRDICPRPRRLSPEQRESLIEEHKNIIFSAFNATTLSAALVNVTHGFMWAIGVGDSTIALSTADDDGTRRSTRLVKAHNFKDPDECFYMCMNRPEEVDVIENERLLKSAAMSRAIGNYAFKCPASYSKYLFKFLPWSGETDFNVLAKRIKKPPYMSAEPSVKFVDLQPYRSKHPVLTIFTDGVDNVVDGKWVFRPGSPSGADPCEVVSKLLQFEMDPSLEELLGHHIEPRWSRSEGNKAVDILGNLVGGTSADRLKMVLDQDRLVDEDPVSGLYIDDVSIIVYEISS
ncbi:protein serine/threonine phosphatase 2C [Polyporus arcularius HHB13444]|uniref:Protein serine/threonine phosphatase 2C n=1 Tax=Polyporus arcularius HHB13444 TaxID=1314778 RepID=A0A5C3Q181_9APHY|nr:protein serine/threonine phosphatase 2C [Polyporus arcularius HHB13444]